MHLGPHCQGIDELNSPFAKGKKKVIRHIPVAEGRDSLAGSTVGGMAPRG